MSRLEPGSPAHQLVTARAKEGLADARGAVRAVLGAPRLGPLHQAMAIEGLRTDLEWLSTLVARVDGETPQPLIAWLDVELQRLRRWLGTAHGPEPDVRDESLRAGCWRMQAILLERRIERELARSTADWSADGLWAERFHLSRLQTRAETLELEPSARNGNGELRGTCPVSMRRPATFTAAPAEDVFAQRVPLEQRRGALAGEAFLHVSALSSPNGPQLARRSSRRPSTK